MNACPLLAAEDAENIACAARLLRAGKIVVYPTDTLYAIGVDATNAAAVAALYAIKERAANKPLIVLCADTEEAQRYARFDARARRLARRFWPGPLTMILPRREPSPIASAISAGTGTLALRVPDCAITLALLRACERPLAAPSANREGEPTPETAAAIAERFGPRLAAVLDAGRAREERASTVIDLCQATPRLIRGGSLENRVLKALAPLADSKNR